MPSTLEVILSLVHNMSQGNHHLCFHHGLILGSKVLALSHKAHFIESRATVWTQRERKVVMTKLKEEAVSIRFLVHYKDNMTLCLYWSHNLQEDAICEFVLSIRVIPRVTNWQFSHRCLWQEDNSPFWQHLVLFLRFNHVNTVMTSPFKIAVFTSLCTSCQVASTFQHATMPWLLSQSDSRKLIIQQWTRVSPCQLISEDTSKCELKVFCSA